MSGQLTAVPPMNPALRHHITDVTGLSGPQKAAIVIRMILTEGGEMSLSNLSPALQLKLATEYASIVRVNKATMDAVVAEFEAGLETAGLEFPENADDVLDHMQGLLAPDMTNELRDRFGLGADNDPWRAIQEMEPGQIAKMLGQESPFVGALVLSKLKPDLASEVLELMEGDIAKSMMLAIANTNAVPPDPVHRIGGRVAELGTQKTVSAFDKTPVLRTAAILNATSTEQREALLAAFEEQDASFAKQVRKAIFTFADIPKRIKTEDIAKFVRNVPAEAMVMALAAGQAVLPEAVDFILDNMSKRMAQGLREEMVELGEVAPKPGEAAMSQVTSVIRAMVDEGTLKLVEDEEDEDG